VAYNAEEFQAAARWGLASSIISEILIEESIIGWKEFELEVMRDLADNVVIVCSIENLDPMGVHTGDSITVAPAQTLTDVEYQRMRDAAIDIIRRIGVETGGSNIQFAVDPHTGKMVVIEMNPRVSRSSALASKATGFPIAKIAAKLAVGYTLDEIPNDITLKTPACFEPALDYCVVKIPRFTFEKFPGAEPTLTTSMKSVGEAMSIGRTFTEALQKGLRSLETGLAGLTNLPPDIDEDEIRKRLTIATPDRILYLKRAIQDGMSVSEIFALSGIDPWFLNGIREICELEDEIKGFARRKGKRAAAIPPEVLAEAKQFGFSDKQLAELLGTGAPQIRKLRKEHNIVPQYKLVDTCAAEFEAYTPYYYSTYERPPLRAPRAPKPAASGSANGRKIMILGGGPNRIGQGIEFDYCCVHACFAIRQEGIESIMVNCNPETVSTDYDTSDRLYFEPLTLEDVLNLIDREQPEGVIIQFGGQTPLNLALPLSEAGVTILGTSPDAIDRAEDRKRFTALLRKVGLTQPPNGTAVTFEQASKIANRIGYPVLVRPSYVLGGRAMEIVYTPEELREFMEKAVIASPERPILVDKFLEDAVEIDVDAVCDGKRTVIAGIMEHIEEAGIHSGDSFCVLPPYTLSEGTLDLIRKNTAALAGELGVRGLLNIQYAVRNDIIYVLEVNPRASRTVPFVSKATGVPWAKVATKIIIGKTLDELGITKEVMPPHFSVKAPVFPFARFPGVDPVLGPEMKSTGEAMGIDEKFGVAYAKSQPDAANCAKIPERVFVSVTNRDKRAIISIAKRLTTLGASLICTHGTASVLRRSGIEVEEIPKIQESKRPDITDLIKSGKISLLINTPSGRRCRPVEVSIRATAGSHGIPLVTTISGAEALV
ncbi:MAG: carbamoyl-phosphate synthase large subunit, partial [Planctomycetia bacterium]|nr:carbamoyl-phosphate synthase large subunit [Planctomycetia bacterium]